MNTLLVLAVAAGITAAPAGPSQVCVDYPILVTRMGQLEGERRDIGDGLEVWMWSTGWRVRAITVTRTPDGLGCYPSGADDVIWRQE